MHLFPKIFSCIQTVTPISTNLVGGWTNPSEKNMSQNGVHPPQIEVNIKKYFETTT